MMVTASISSEPVAIGTSTVLLAEVATILIGVKFDCFRNSKLVELDAACTPDAESFRGLFVDPKGLLTIKELLSDK